MSKDFEKYKEIVEKNLNIIYELLLNITDEQNMSIIHKAKAENKDFNQLVPDFNNILDELLRVKNQLKEQNTINELRIRIWKIAAQKYLSENVIIQKLLNLIGPFFDVSYAGFYRLKKSNAVCEIQWRNKGNKSTLGFTIPYHIHNQFYDKEHVLLYTSNVPQNIEKEIYELFKKTGVHSFLAIPYRGKNKLLGFFNFSEKDPHRKWEKTEIEILKEVSKIISIKTMELHAEDALIHLTENLDKKVAYHTLELQKANRNMKKDINRRKKVEKALRESEELYRTLIYTSPNPVIITDLNLKITMVNRAALELSNLDDMSYIIGQSTFNFIAREDHERAVSTIETLFKNGNLITNEFSFLKYDGTPYPAELSASLICDSDENAIGILVIIRDLTARKNAEEALEKEKELFEVTLRSINDAVVILNMEKKVVFLNRAAESLINREQTMVIGNDFQTMFSFMGKNNTLYDPHLISNLLEEGKMINFFADTLLVLYKGQKIPIAGSGAPIHSRDSTLIGAVLVFRDISEQKKMENELLKARNMESLGVLAGGLAHDFNNILTGIITNVSLAQTIVKGSEEVKEFLKNAGQAALRASRLTSQLLTFSKGGVPVKESTSIKDLIIESANFCLSGANVQCEFILPDDLWAIEVDRSQVYQVLTNIIFNAKESMPYGGKIKLTACNLEIPGDHETECRNILKNGKYIKVIIQDEGCGIKEENLEKIFDPYFTTKETGTGLGLTSAYSIIQKHSGYINVESQPGSGTTFVFYLPATGKISVTKDKVVHLDFTGSGTILIMDDDEDVRKVIVRLLIKVGYDVISTSEGGQAIKAYKKAKEKGKPFNLVIMDLTVRGGMQGMDAVRSILQYDPDAKILVASGYSNAWVMSHYEDYGIKAVIAKPFAIEVFLDLIKKICSE